MAVTLIGNVLEKGDECPPVSRASKALHSKLLSRTAGERLLAATGFKLDEAADKYVFDASLGEDEVARRRALLRAAMDRAAGVLEAVIRIGDGNAPDVALRAVAITKVYLENIVANPEDAAKRSISAGNKALAARLLAAEGGEALLTACGFDLGGEAYVCSDPPGPLPRVALATLCRADDVWGALAAEAGGPGGGASGGDSAHGTAAEPLSGFKVLELPPLASLEGRQGVADMEPALVLTDGRSAVELHCWLPCSKRWRKAGSMPIPSTSFTWCSEAVPPSSARAELVLEVDLGDGKPLPLGVRVAGDDPENEYIAAQRFIDDHFEALNNNHLEEIARNIRQVVAPVLQTVANLKDAVQAQLVTCGAARGAGAARRAARGKSSAPRRATRSAAYALWRSTSARPPYQVIRLSLL
eukprot:CAMPEP_0206020610 /NCGR_PEP_ID=MMETSP1464-20131121/31348_1 /ASSEMBLY_ACC=CAM_ASM_001124 /TAXON_ID=119497 /ORGANISM="Exanthemachrysis gayraliae, Strain RCC1523" /LENGTH=413 /DNA_ID=CAMNT_0053394545 /DNA_START=15 /DNA_END=1251 /DNA_ORIENTATION=+